MSEIRLVAIDSNDAQAIESMLADGEVGGPSQPAWLNWRKMWDAGITEEEGVLTVHAVESHGAFAPEHELGPLRVVRDKLRSAFNEPVPEDSPDA